jgi:hypothetical protein
VSFVAILLTRSETNVFEFRNNLLFVSLAIKDFISWVRNLNSREGREGGHI